PIYIGRSDDATGAPTTARSRPCTVGVRVRSPGWWRWPRWSPPSACSSPPCQFGPLSEDEIECTLAERRSGRWTRIAPPSSREVCCGTSRPGRTRAWVAPPPPVRRPLQPFVLDRGGGGGCPPPS